MKARSLLQMTACAVLFVSALVLYRVHFDAEGTLRNLGYESTALATSLLDNHAFADPFRVPTGPSAFLAPVYPVLIAVIMFWFGTGAKGIFALQWTVTVLIALQMAAWPWIAEKVRVGCLAGFVAAVVWLLSNMPRNDVWEAHLAGLLFVLLALAMVRATEAPSWQRSMASGLFWGVTLLCAPIALLVLLAWGMWVSVTRRLRPKLLGLLLLSAAAVVTPWMARNYVVFHHVVYVRDNFGLELEIDNNNCASYLFELNQYSGCYGSIHPNDSRTQAASVQRLGEVEFDRQQMAAAEKWIWGNPWRFAELCMQRAAAFWAPAAMPYMGGSNPPRRRWIITIMNVLSIPGLLLLRKRSPEFTWVCFLFIISYSIPYYLVQHIERYVIPLLWATFLPAAYVLVEVGRRILRQSEMVI
jgi:hypothetical protein